MILTALTLLMWLILALVVFAIACRLIGAALAYVLLWLFWRP